MRCNGPEASAGLRRYANVPNANFKVIADWVDRTPWVDFLAEDPATRSNTSVCLKIADREIASPEAQADLAKKIASILEKEGVAIDIGAYRDAPAGLRIWAGATVERSDLEALMPWLDWAFAAAKTGLAKAA